MPHFFSARRPFIPLGILAALAFLISAILALRYANQLPLDMYAFRQSQTALTAYWFLQGGFRWAYETPVGGPPWSLPFEFPIYQGVVALMTKMTAGSLDAVGRLVSYAFLVACVWPTACLTRRLKLPSGVVLVFAALLFSSPVYLYWGRSFMIETAAVFFTLCALAFWLAALQARLAWRPVLATAVFMALALLQKATTPLPAVLLCGIGLLVFGWKQWRQGSFPVVRFLAAGVLVFVLPLALGSAWVRYTDHVKMLSVFGSQLTSAALGAWNWGLLDQRFSSDLFRKVFWTRILQGNLAGPLGVALLLATVLARRIEWRVRAVVAVSLLLGLLPLFIFSNLHIVHTYYQSANLIFFIYALAVVLGAVALPRIGAGWTAGLVAVCMLSNYVEFTSGYYQAMKEAFGKTNRDVVVGSVLRREVAVADQFVVFGNDWSSTMTYLAQRKSFALPAWIAQYSEMAAAPEKLVDASHLGAVVSCTDRAPVPSHPDLLAWASNGRRWKMADAAGCGVLTPEKTWSATAAAVNDNCLGTVDEVGIQQRADKPVLVFSGWSAIATSRALPAESYFRLTAADGEVRYLQGMYVPRAEANSRMGLAADVDAGVSRVIPADIPPGIYQVDLARSDGSLGEICKFRRSFTMPGSL